MNEKEGEILLPNTGLKLRQKRRDKGKRHNLDDNTDFSNRSNLKRRDSCVQNFSLRYFHIEKKLRSESLANPEVKISLRLSASSWFNLEVGIVDLPKDSGHLDDIIKIANGDWEK
ncbi:MAG: hypothetical protein V8K32_09055 [Candidatus Electrothrix gigas]